MRRCLINLKENTTFIVLPYAGFRLHSARPTVCWIGGGDRFMDFGQTGNELINHSNWFLGFWLNC